MVNFDNFWGLKFVLQFHILYLYSNFHKRKESLSNPHTCEEQISVTESNILSHMQDSIYHMTLAGSNMFPLAKAYTEC